MHDVDMHSASEPEQSKINGDQFLLNSVDKALRAALDDEFVSASVVRERARLSMMEAQPSFVRTALSRARPVATTIAAFYELERRGFAERIEVAGCVRWRRAREAQPGD